MAEDRMLHKDEHRLSEILKPMPAKTMADEPSLSEIVAGAGEEKKERQPKHHNEPRSFDKLLRQSSGQVRTSKKKVDIADLKKALEQSLAKNFGDEEVKEKTDESVI